MTRFMIVNHIEHYLTVNMMVLNFFKLKLKYILVLKHQ